MDETKRDIEIPYAEAHTLTSNCRLGDSEGQDKDREPSRSIFALRSVSILERISWGSRCMICECSRIEFIATPPSPLTTLYYNHCSDIREQKLLFFDSFFFPPGSFWMGGAKRQAALPHHPLCQPQLVLANRRLETRSL